MTKNRYAYLLVFDVNVGTLEKVSKFLDKREDVFQNWMTILPNSFFVISDNLRSVRTNAVLAGADRIQTFASSEV